MTREEQINQASGAYAFQLCAECINNEICKEMGLGCPRLRESIIAFSEGVKWADEHPDTSALWHSADEEPEGNNWKILCQDEMNGCWVENRVDAMLLHNTWNEYAGIEMLVKWAYIRDLLPKGGKE